MIKEQKQVSQAKMRKQELLFLGQLQHQYHKEHDQKLEQQQKNKMELKRLEQKEKEVLDQLKQTQQVQQDEESKLGSPKRHQSSFAYASEKRSEGKAFQTPSSAHKKEEPKVSGTKLEVPSQKHTAGKQDQSDPKQVTITYNPDDNVALKKPASLAGRVGQGKIQSQMKRETVSNATSPAKKQPAKPATSGMASRVAGQQVSKGMSRQTA